MNPETKAHLNQETIDALQGLIEMNIDAATGFQTAAAQAEDVAIKELLSELGERRQEQANELRGLLLRNAAEPAGAGTTAAALHRAWISVRTAVSQNVDYSLLVESGRGETLLRERYKQVLLDHPGAAVNDVLHRHFTEVNSTVERLEGLQTVAAS